MKVTVLSGQILTRSCRHVLQSGHSQHNALLTNGLNQGRRQPACRYVVLAAKKGGGKGGGAKKKGPGSLMGPVEKLPYMKAEVIMTNLLLVESYRRRVGKPIMEDVEIAEAAKALWEAPFIVLAHDKFISEDPKFIYANKAALDLWETTWDEFIGMPSSRSAEEKEDIQADRQALLEEAAQKGVVTYSSARRVSLKGRPFELQDSVLFNIESPSGNKVGQAVVCHTWAFEDGTVGGPGAPPETVAAPIAYTPEDVAALESAVAEQAALVRDLKEVKGLTKADLELQEAVADLLERKETLEAAKKSLEPQPEPVEATA